MNFKDKKAILDLIENPSFEDVIKAIKLDIVEKMFITRDLTILAQLRDDVHAVDRLYEKLVSFANELRMENNDT
jgi:phosphate uptake regulator